MTSAGRLTGFWMVALISLYGAHFGGTLYTLNEPDVPFPPARPTAQNLAAVCHQGQGRPRYPDSFFPRTGASHFRRRGTAINRMEAWFSFCCSGDAAQQSSQILCCTEQAWMHALSLFCIAEFSTMTLAYECCDTTGDPRWSCFNEIPINPSYSPKPGYEAPLVPAEDGLFSFNSSACQ